MPIFEILIIKDHEYPMNARPESGTGLFLEKKQQIMGDLDLEAIVKNLDLCVDMYKLAYIGATAANAGVVKSKIIELQNDFGVICVDAKYTMGILQTSASNVLELLLQAYKQLIAGQDKVALAKLKRCSDSAAAMATAAKDLSGRFSALQSKSSMAKSEAALAQASEEEKRRKAESEIKEFNEKMKGLNKLTQELSKQMEDAKADQQKAEKKVATSEKQAFILGIIGLVANTAAAGLQTYAQMRNPLAGLVAQNQTGTQDNPELKKQTDEWSAANQAFIKAKQEAAGAQLKLDTAKGLIESTQKELDAIKAKGKLEAEDDAAYAARVAEKQDLINAEKAKLPNLQKDYDSAQDASTQAGAKSQSLGAAAKALSQGTDNMAKQSFSAADAAREALDKAMEQKETIRKEQNKNIVDISVITGQLAATKVVGQNSDVAVKALTVSMYAISQVIRALNDAAMFWNQIAVASSNLDKMGMDKEVIDFESLDSESRITAYKSDDFKFNYLSNMCSWAVLHDIAEDYVHAIEQSRNLNNDNIANSVDSPQVARELVASFAAQVNAKANKYAQETMKLGVL